MHQENLADSDLSFNIRKATLDDWSGHVDPNDAQLEREVRNELADRSPKMSLS